MYKSAESLSRSITEFDKGHLSKFALSWILLNKRMYLRWVYYEVRDLMPECFLRVS